MKQRGMLIEASTEIQYETGLVKELDTGLHEMSQPLTALLFLLEFGASTDSLEEIKMAISSGLEQCVRLTGSVRAMQMQVRHAMKRVGASP